MPYKSIRFIFIIVLYSVLISSVNAKTSFIVAGHLYGITNDKDALEKLTIEFESLDPDYIFILGDSSLDDQNIYSYFNNRFKGRIYFSPGNHEMVNGSLQEYIRNVGYAYKIIETDNVNFILINSLDSALNINSFLKTAVKNNINKVQIVLTHHRIWDDSLTSGFPYQHDKSYYFKEIYPSMVGVDAIFSGNSKRQYFTDYKKINGLSLQNVNNIYWVDQVGGIDGYSIGAGDGKPKLGFVYVEENNGRLLVEPHHINFDEGDLVSISKIRAVPWSIAPGNFDSVDSVLSQSIKNFLQSTRKRYIFLLGILIGGLSIFPFYIYYFRRVKAVKKVHDCKKI